MRERLFAATMSVKAAVTPAQIYMIQGFSITKMYHFSGMGGKYENLMPPSTR